MCKIPHLGDEPRAGLVPVYPPLKHVLMVGGTSSPTSSRFLPIHYIISSDRSYPWGSDEVCSVVVYYTPSTPVSMGSMIPFFSLRERVHGWTTCYPINYIPA
jgi:hypothetical protein